MNDCDSSSDNEPDAVEVAVQLSRFHMETLEGSATGDVDVRGLCLSVGDRELLRDAHLSLRKGVRYGLVGRNGAGKSTLLKACANKSIPGLPRDMKVLYVQQDNVPGDERSALQTVLDVASARGALQAQIDELEAALLDDQEEGEGDLGQEEGAGGETGGSEARAQRLVRCVRRILAGRAESQAVQAEQTAARRSRARGKEALRNAVEAREAARKAREEQLTHEKAASLAPQLLADLYDNLDQLGGSAEEEQRAAAAVLEGLGFGRPHTQEVEGTPTRELSGGWRMRVALACALLSQPHLLLLDEPTNHLDIASILWLQDYLSQRCPGQTVVLVSHDRAFLNAVAQETVLLREGRLEYFPGTYDAYMQARAEASLHKERQVAGQERQRAHLQETISRAERAAREAGDDKRLLQAASRRKKMDRLGAEKTADGKRFKVSYWAGWHETLRPQVELDRPEEPVMIQFPPPDQLRQRGPLLQLRDVTVAYGNVDLRAAAAAAAGGGGGGGGGGSLGAKNPGAKKCAAVVAAQPFTGKASAKGQPSRAAAAAAAATATAGSKRGGGATAAAAPPTSSVGASSGAGAGSGASGSGGLVVLRDVTMDVEQGARIGLLGLNGSGKSSLLRVLVGELAPAAGEVSSPCGSRLLVGRLDQHSGQRLLLQQQQEQGQERGPVGVGGVGGGKAAGGEGPRTAFSAVQVRAPHLRPQEVYDYLGKFAVPGPMANTPLSALSGGQRCRVALALEMLPRPHVLLLDEPTNHLDLLTVQALSGALRDWEGAVIIASHDLQFLRDTCHQVWVVEGGAVTRQPQPEPADAVNAFAARLMDRLRRRADTMRGRQ